MMSLVGIKVNVVDAGTVVGKGPDGQEFVVTDESAVFNGPKMWVTAKVYDALKAKANPTEGDKP